MQRPWTCSSQVHQVYRTYWEFHFYHRYCLKNSVSQSSRHSLPSLLSSFTARQLGFLSWSLPRWGQASSQQRDTCTQVFWQRSLCFELDSRQASSLFFLDLSLLEAIFDWTCMSWTIWAMLRHHRYRRLDSIGRALASNLGVLHASLYLHKKRVSYTTYIAFLTYLAQG